MIANEEANDRIGHCIPTTLMVTSHFIRMDYWLVSSLTSMVLYTPSDAG
jgi:hypothetical protein